MKCKKCLFYHRKGWLWFKKHHCIVYGRFDISEHTNNCVFFKKRNFKRNFCNEKTTVAIWHRKPTTEPRYEALTSFGFCAILRVIASVFIKFVIHLKTK